MSRPVAVPQTTNGNQVELRCGSPIPVPIQNVGLLRLSLRALASRHQVLQPGRRENEQRREHVAEKEIDPDQRGIERAKTESRP